MSVARTLASLRESGSRASLAPAVAAFGIVLVALGWILEKESVGIGAAIRMLGGILFLAGLATVVFGDSRRRTVALDISKRTLARYMSRTVSMTKVFRTDTGDLTRVIRTDNQSH